MRACAFYFTRRRRHCCFTKVPSVTAVFLSLSYILSVKDIIVCTPTGRYGKPRGQPVRETVIGRFDAI